MTMDDSNFDLHFWKHFELHIPQFEEAILWPRFFHKNSVSTEFIRVIWQAQRVLEAKWAKSPHDQRHFYLKSFFFLMQHSFMARCWHENVRWMPVCCMRERESVCVTSYCVFSVVIACSIAMLFVPAILPLKMAHNFTHFTIYECNSFACLLAICAGYIKTMQHFYF